MFNKAAKRRGKYPSLATDTCNVNGLLLPGVKQCNRFIRFYYILNIIAAIKRNVVAVVVVKFLLFYRIMYWTDWGLNPKIEKADMTGKQRLVLVSSSLHWPNGLTLDKANNRLYWVDGYLNKLEYLNLITHVRVTLISSSATLPHPFGLTLLGDYLFWTDWGNNTVYRANKESGGEVTAFITGINRPMDIHAYNLDHAAQGETTLSTSES